MSSKNKRIIKARAAKVQAKSKITQQSKNGKTSNRLGQKDKKKGTLPPSNFEYISFLVKARDLLSQVRF